MKNQQVTLKTLARELNLSTSTVSRALADEWDVSRKTKEMVVALAMKLNYKPNIIGVKLKKGQSKRNNDSQPRVTIKDLARLLDIAPSTVSRALANKQDINPDTRKAVKALARKLH